jgi:uncharacterized protein YbjT (DUF2867 family)
MAAPQRSRTICVLGGTGFVGRHLAAELVRRGHTVRVPTRNRQRHRAMLVLPGVELVQTDVHAAGALTRLLDGCDAAVNLVGILNERGHDGSGFHHAHVELVEKLLNACHETGVPRLIQMSALKANAERGPSHYLRTKGQAEKVIRTLAGGEIRYTIFRPSTIFGRDDSFINRFARLLKLAPILPLPQADARFAPVYVGDVVGALARALEDSSTYDKTYELCGPEIYSLGEIVAYVRGQLGLRRWVIGMPKPLGRIQAAVADYLVPGKPFSIDNFKSLTVASVCTDNGLKALGIEPTPMSSIVPEFLGGKPTRGDVLRRTSRR